MGDMDLPEAQEYAIALKKAESNLERRESRGASAMRNGSGRRTKSGRKLPQPNSASARPEPGMGDSFRSNRSDDEGMRGSQGSQGRAAVDASYKDPIGDLPARP